MNKWWGYLHVNGSVQAKRFFNNKDLDEAMDSDFVLGVYGAFDAEDRKDALEQLEKVFIKGPNRRFLRTSMAKEYQSMDTNTLRLCYSIYIDVPVPLGIEDKGELLDHAPEAVCIIGKKEIQHPEITWMELEKKDGETIEWMM